MRDARVPFADDVVVTIFVDVLGGMDAIEPFGRALEADRRTRSRICRARSIRRARCVSRPADTSPNRALSVQVTRVPNRPRPAPVRVGDLV
jgi:hypothetical protein